jgi:hypothetical protein
MFSGAPTVTADVNPGDVIDKSNWEKVQGMVPDSVLEWLKRGDLNMDIVELNYDPNEYIPPVVKQSMEANKGRFDVDANDLMVDLKTGKIPESILGVPFPEIDPKDPKAGTKLMYNKYYHCYACGNINYPFAARWVGRNSGFEREVICDYKQYPLDGYAGAKEQKNSENLERMVLILVLAPFDIKGTNILNWRYRDDRQDSTFGYVPAIRRVRRMSPANRSDSFIGSDACIDDAWTFDGKVITMDWKFAGKRDGLVAFLDPEPARFEIDENGSWVTSKQVKDPVYGYQKEGWQGAPWMPTNLVWVKRPMYVIELKPKDPYYNYGPQEFWVDAENQILTVRKVINDRAGKHWKTTWEGWCGFEGRNEKERAIVAPTLLMIDERTDHTTIIRLFTPKYQVSYYDKMDRNGFTLAGFQKFCK